MAKASPKTGSGPAFTFGNVKIVEAAKPSKKSDRLEIVTEGIRDLAALDVLLNTFQVVRDDIEAEISRALNVGVAAEDVGTAAGSADIAGSE